MTSYAIRYVPGTDLACRFPEPTSTTWDSRDEAENVRRNCPNADRMEVFVAGTARLPVSRSRKRSAERSLPVGNLT